jgi:hypothetical protein
MSPTTAPASSCPSASAPTMATRAIASTPRLRSTITERPTSKARSAESTATAAPHTASPAVPAPSRWSRPPTAREAAANAARICAWCSRSQVKLAPDPLFTSCLGRARRLGSLCGELLAPPVSAIHSFLCVGTRIRSGRWPVHDLLLDLADAVPASGLCSRHVVFAATIYAQTTREESGSTPGLGA